MQVPDWYWLMDFIDKGFTPRQIYTEFSMEDITRCRAYWSERARAQNEALEKAHKKGSGKGRITQKKGRGVTAPARSLF